ncbi:MAG: hypothetical protein ACI4PQ_07610 [Butyricicoccaceae bacterium]
MTLTEPQRQLVRTINAYFFDKFLIEKPETIQVISLDGRPVSYQAKLLIKSRIKPNAPMEYGTAVCEIEPPFLCIKKGRLDDIVQLLCLMV